MNSHTVKWTLFVQHQVACIVLKEEDVDEGTSSLSSLDSPDSNFEIVRGHASLLQVASLIKEECPFDLTTLKTLKYEQDESHSASVVPSSFI